ncbi:MAG: MFS transporter [Gammaproteobacteria bacterium]|nr:MFS transporter [Gammaproteobacteria bacterium]MCP4089440.1 MFS transporter [Gammaproteobacteria bacterium]MCP4277556.1 MFS transporter [Gammaproteobacteria bacterium]MCP4831164.1 MFS transporter [Gammaproteobacteria bacterium]MCP4929207.1 MFS transporter [Gammaproteobacteria bacterium]
MQNSTTQQSPSPLWPKPAVAWFGVGVLVVAFIFSIADRIIISLLVDPIKADLGLTDTDMGLMMGLAFAIFYALMGLPIGRFADKYSRRIIIGSGIFIWSIMTALCGLARSFTTLFLARVGVGVGQATLSPAAYSMIADYFPKDKLGRALGVYQSGAFFGIGLAFIFGGLAIQFAAGSEAIALPVIGSVKPWQMAFIVIGLPGVLVALMMFAVKEPVRQGVTAAQKNQEIGLGDAFRFIFQRKRVFLAHYTGFALLALPMTTLATWVPPYFMRVVGMSPPETGFKLGLIVLICAPIGVISGGWLSDTLLKKGFKDAALRVAVFTAVLMVPLSILATTIKDPILALVVIAPFAFGASISMGLAPTALQLVTPNRLRAQVSAAWMLFLNIITAGLGPTAVGWINDTVFGDPMAVGQSIAAVNAVSVFLGGLILWLTLKPFKAAVAEQAD